ncbi:hypothetical protein BLA29_011614 [Euroglyphus maynei]|uniref:Uncharacterized protein n=1 Tax=Euroglyphus maynei TaxID=6958 RepID=A0A1Y3APX7_EURMA|nr:hypothetical protein BLA29_011614 [Euroglyphus maynei]
MTGFSFIILSAIVCWGYWRHMNNKSLPGQRLYTLTNRSDTPEREAMFDLHKRFVDMDLMGNFKMDHFNDFGELKRLGPQVNDNFDDIRHQGQVFRREELGRDVTKIVESKSKSLKEFDQALRQEKSN